jgi:AcrR family transcriptional regulator
MAARKTRRLGRPPASSSAETRERILDVARESFATLGYGVTTNKYVATKAGITTGALYHYFDSKLAIYEAVYRGVQAVVYERFRAAMTAKESFIDQFAAILEVAHQLNAEDPSLARFLGSARIDLARHDELRDRIHDAPGEGRAVLKQLLDRAVATGEIAPARRAEMEAFLRTVFVGLVDAVSDDLNAQRAAIDGVLSLMRGSLLRAPQASASRPKRSR